MEEQQTLSSWGFPVRPKLYYGGNKYMATIKQEARDYEGAVTKNITDLQKISVDIEITENTYTKEDGEDFSIKEFEVEGQKYRMPNSVLANLKVILEKKPELKCFSVSKTGEGMQTKYTVVPLE